MASIRRCLTGRSPSRTAACTRFRSRPPIVCRRTRPCTSTARKWFTKRGPIPSVTTTLTTGAQEVSWALAGALPARRTSRDASTPRGSTTASSPGRGCGRTARSTRCATRTRSGGEAATACSRRSATGGRSMRRPRSPARTTRWSCRLAPTRSRSGRTRRSARCVHATAASATPRASTRRWTWAGTSSR